MNEKSRKNLLQQWEEGKLDIQKKADKKGKSNGPQIEEDFGSPIV